MFSVFPILWASLGVATAGEAGVVVEEEGVDLSVPKAGQMTAFKQAEYNRLSERLRRMSSKGNAKATDRIFTQLEELDVPFAFSELLIGAQVFRARGNVGGAYAALKTAARLDGTREVIDWLVAIDEQFGRVELRVAAKKRPSEDAPLMASGVGMLMPDQKAAIAFANQQLTEGAVFVGLLPLGQYQLNGVPFRVAKKAPPHVLDLSGPK